MTNARIPALFLSAGLCVASLAHAQTPGSSASNAPVAATRPPPTPPSTDDEENFFRFYGSLNPRVIASSGATESYSQPNAVAVTAAGNPVFSTAADAARYSFQIAQSRVGFWLNEKGRVRAQVEVDFVDFTKATPTVASLPRLRIGRVDYAFSPEHIVSLGQDWDLHAPINPHGINLVGALFQGGNTAFMREQVKYLYLTPSLELGAALGFPAPNNTAKDGAFELGLLPTVAVRGAYKFGASRVGASAIATRVPFNLGQADERRANAFAVALFADLSPSPSTQVRMELNAGQNSANLGLLSLAQGRLAEDLREAGGFLSARHVLGGPHAVYGMVGYQRVLEPEKVVPSYGYASLPANGDPPAFTTATLSGTGPGMLHNGSARVGYEWRPMRKLAFVLEGFLFHTRFRLLEVDAARTAAARTTVGIETGALLSF